MPKTLILWLVVALLLAASVAPASAAPRQAEQIQAPGTTVWSMPGGVPVILPIRLQPNGGCQDGGASGCPRPD